MQGEEKVEGRLGLTKLKRLEIVSFLLNTACEVCNIALQGCCNCRGVRIFSAGNGRDRSFGTRIPFHRYSKA